MPCNSEHVFIDKGVDYVALLVAGALESFEGRFDEDCTTRNEQAGRVRRRGCSIGRRTYLVLLAISIDCRVSAVNTKSSTDSKDDAENDEQNRTHRRRVGLGERLSRLVRRHILRSRPLRRRPRRAF
jgi:hypothetical protein